MKRSPLYIILLILSLLCCSSIKAQDYRDVVYLKNGSVIKGFYQELYPADSLHMQTIDGGVFVCAMTDVERIAKERTNVYLIDMSSDLKHQNSEWRHRGYRGTIEYSYSTNTDDNKVSVNGITTVHGYQFNQYFYLGLGVGIQQISYKSDGITYLIDQRNIPIFGDLRYYLIPHCITPMVDLRIGYTVSGYKGFHYNPCIGVDFSFTPRCGFFILAGYDVQHYEINNEMKKSKSITVNFGIHF